MVNCFVLSLIRQAIAWLKFTKQSIVSIEIPTADVTFYIQLSINHLEDKQKHTDRYLCRTLLSD